MHIYICIYVYVYVYIHIFSNISLIVIVSFSRFSDVPSLSIVHGDLFPKVSCIGIVHCTFIFTGIIYGTQAKFGEVSLFLLLLLSLFRYLSNPLSRSLFLAPPLSLILPAFCSVFHRCRSCNTLQHTATHCNTLQHFATHCNTLSHLRSAAHPTVAVPATQAQHFVAYSLTTPGGWTGKSRRKEKKIAQKSDLQSIYILPSEASCSPTTPGGWTGQSGEKKGIRKEREKGKERKIFVVRSTAYCIWSVI